MIKNIRQYPFGTFHALTGLATPHFVGPPGVIIFISNYAIETRSHLSTIKGHLLIRGLLASALRMMVCVVSLKLCLAIRARVADAPDRVRAVVAHQQRSVLSHRNPDGPTPDVSVVHYKSGQEIFVLAAGPARLVQRHADYFITDSHRPVP